MRKFLPVNESAMDRGVRVIAGAGLVAAALAGYGAWAYIGIVPLLTGLAGSCPAYTLFEMSTCRVKATSTT